MPKDATNWWEEGLGFTNSMSQVVTDHSKHRNDRLKNTLRSRVSSVTSIPGFFTRVGAVTVEVMQSSFPLCDSYLDCLRCGKPDRTLLLYSPRVLFGTNLIKKFQSPQKLALFGNCHAKIGFNFANGEKLVALSKIEDWVRKVFPR